MNIRIQVQEADLESVEATEVVSARSDVDGMALLQRKAKTGTAMHRVMVTLPRKRLSTRSHPEGAIYIKETSRRPIEVLKKILSNCSAEKQSLLRIWKIKCMLSN